MKKEVNFYRKRYEPIWKVITWQSFPLQPNTLFCSDDNAIRNVLISLNKVDPSTPGLDTFEQATTDLHWAIVSHEEEFVLYWLSHYIQEGDRGFVLYRFQNFVVSPVNFLDFGRRFKLPDDSTAKIYMDVFSRLNEWAKLLELPYRYEVVLEENHMGFQKNFDKSTTTLNLDHVQPVIKSKSTVNSLSILWDQMMKRIKNSLHTDNI